MVTRTKLTKEVMEKIEKLNKEYSEQMVRFAIWHLMDIGVRTASQFTDEFLEKSYQDEVKKQENLPENTIALMTPEFIRDINVIARELAKISVSELLKYIQNEIYIY